MDSEASRKARGFHEQTLQQAMAGREVALDQAMQSSKELGRYIIIGCGGGVVLLLSRLDSASTESSAVLVVGIVFLTIALYFGIRALHQLTSSYITFADEWVKFERSCFKMTVAAVSGDAEAMASQLPARPELNWSNYLHDLYRSYRYIIAGASSGLIYILLPENTQIIPSIRDWLVQIWSSLF